MAHIVNGQERYWINADDVAKLVKHGLIEPHEDDNGDEVDDEHVIAPELLDEWPNLTPAQTIELVRYLELAESKEKLSDWETLELINFALSIPEWPTSLIEDIAAIVRRTGRKEVPGATWASH